MAIISSTKITRSFDEVATTPISERLSALVLAVFTVTAIFGSINGLATYEHGSELLMAKQTVNAVKAEI